jgi:general secretion pathway protein E
VSSRDDIAPWHAVASRELLLQCSVCPTGTDESDEALVVWCATAEGVAVAHEIAYALGRHARIEMRDRQEITAAIERHAGRAAGGAEHIPGVMVAADPLDDPASLALQPPIVRFVSLLLREAILSGASDIHLDAEPGGLVVRLRRDGVLVPGPDARGISATAVLSRVKLLADLDITERRRPQDGRMRSRIGDADVDLRVATIPTIHGEGMVIRVLDVRTGLLPVDRLGMPEEISVRFRRALGAREGLLLVTGPTGSGKTTTLYAALAERATGSEKILSIEDPVEIQLAGVTQVPVHRETGLSFADALRSLLRHDPDVMLVGELRDAETAAVAVQAAMTGHLVLATLHTNDAPGAVSRLVDLGVPRFLIAETLLGVLAQRLVRRSCRECADVGAQTGSAMCARCRGTGYSGRIGVFEYLANEAPFTGTILHAGDRVALLRDAQAVGWQPLQHDAATKVADGVTTTTEVRRALGL